MTKNNQKSILDQQKTSQDSIEIGIAGNATEREEIYKIRYQIYVNEMSRNIESADHNNKLLYDENDSWAILLYAKVGRQTIGTIRINIGAVQDFPPKTVNYLSLGAILNNNMERAAFITKLMIIPEYRNSPVLYMLIAKCYELCCENHIQFGFAICNIHLPRLYEQIGFHQYTKSFVLPNYGLQVPIVLLADDLEHLRAVRSPLYRVARKKKIFDIAKVQWFYENFIDNLSLINSQLISEEKLWSIICDRMDSLLTDSISILKNLTIQEAKKFLHFCSIIIPCNEGTLITTQGEISYSYNVLISGKAKSLTFIRPIKEYALPGQQIGTNGLINHTKHTEDIVTLSSAELLAFSGFSFQKFRYLYPEIAHKIVQNSKKSSLYWVCG